MLNLPSNKNCRLPGRPDKASHQRALVVISHRHDTRRLETLLYPITLLEVVNKHELYSNMVAVYVL